MGNTAKMNGTQRQAHEEHILRTLVCHQDKASEKIKPVAIAVIELLV